MRFITCRIFMRAGQQPNQQLRRLSELFPFVSWTATYGLFPSLAYYARPGEAT